MQGIISYFRGAPQYGEAKLTANEVADLTGESTPQEMSLQTFLEDESVINQQMLKPNYWTRNGFFKTTLVGTALEMVAHKIIEELNSELGKETAIRQIARAVNITDKKDAHLTKFFVFIAHSLKRINDAGSSIERARLLKTLRSLLSHVQEKCLESGDNKTGAQTTAFILAMRSLNVELDSVESAITLETEQASVTDHVDSITNDLMALERTSLPTMALAVIPKDLDRDRLSHLSFIRREGTSNDSEVLTWCKKSPVGALLLSVADDPIYREAMGAIDKGYPKGVTPMLPYSQLFGSRLLLKAIKDKEEVKVTQEQISGGDQSSSKSKVTSVVCITEKPKDHAEQEVFETAALGPLTKALDSNKDLIGADEKQSLLSIMRQYDPEYCGDEKARRHLGDAADERRLEELRGSADRLAIHYRGVLDATRDMALAVRTMRQYSKAGKFLGDMSAVGPSGPSKASIDLTRGILNSSVRSVQATATKLVDELEALANEAMNAVIALPEKTLTDTLKLSGRTNPKHILVRNAGLAKARAEVLRSHLNNIETAIQAIDSRIARLHDPREVVKAIQDMSAAGLGALELSAKYAPDSPFFRELRRHEDVIKALHSKCQAAQNQSSSYMHNVLNGIIGSDILDFSAPSHLPAPPALTRSDSLESSGSIDQSEAGPSSAEFESQGPMDRPKIILKTQSSIPSANQQNTPVMQAKWHSYVRYPNWLTFPKDLERPSDFDIALFDPSDSGSSYEARQALENWGKQIVKAAREAYLEQEPGKVYRADERLGNNMSLQQALTACINAGLHTKSYRALKAELEKYHCTILHQEPPRITISVIGIDKLLKNLGNNFAKHPQATNSFVQSHKAMSTDPLVINAIRAGFFNNSDAGKYNTRQVQNLVGILIELLQHNTNGFKNKLERALETIFKNPDRLPRWQQPFFKSFLEFNTNDNQYNIDLNRLATMPVHMQYTFLLILHANLPDLNFYGDQKDCPIGSPGDQIRTYISLIRGSLTSGNFNFSYLDPFVQARQSCLAGDTNLNLTNNTSSHTNSGINATTQAIASWALSFNDDDIPNTYDRYFEQLGTFCGLPFNTLASFRNWLSTEAGYRASDTQANILVQYLLAPGLLRMAIRSYDLSPQDYAQTHECESDLNDLHKALEDQTYNMPRLGNVATATELVSEICDSSDIKALVEQHYLPDNVSEILEAIAQGFSKQNTNLTDIAHWLNSIGIENNAYVNLLAKQLLTLKQNSKQVDEAAIQLFAQHWALYRQWFDKGLYQQAGRDLMNSAYGHQTMASSLNRQLMDRALTGLPIALSISDSKETTNVGAGRLLVAEGIAGITADDIAICEKLLPQGRRCCISSDDLGLHNTSVVRQAYILQSLPEDTSDLSSWINLMQGASDSSQSNGLAKKMMDYCMLDHAKRQMKNSQYFAIKEEHQNFSMHSFYGFPEAYSDAVKVTPPIVTSPTTSSPTENTQAIPASVNEQPSTPPPAQDQEIHEQAADPKQTGDIALWQDLITALHKAASQKRSNQRKRDAFDTLKTQQPTEANVITLLSLVIAHDKKHCRKGTSSGDKLLKLMKKDDYRQLICKKVGWSEREVPRNGKALRNAVMRLQKHATHTSDDNDKVGLIDAENPFNTHVEGIVELSGWHRKEAVSFFRDFQSHFPKSSDEVILDP